jgi:hypothetical protein
MSERLSVCLLCAVAIWASGCDRPRVGAVPAASNAAAGHPADRRNESNMAGVTVAGAGAMVSASVAGMSVPASGTGMGAATSGKGGAELGSAEQAGTSKGGEGGAGGNASVGGDGNAAESSGAGGVMIGAGAGGGGAGGAGGKAGAGGSPSRPIAKFPIRNLIVGACELTHAVPDPSTCTGWDAIYECAARNCELAACEKTCAGFVACAGAAPDPCDVRDSCPASDACLDCTLSVEACATAPCESLFRCAMPSTDRNGACNRLNACCLKQTSPLACSLWHERAAAILGDAGCQMFIDDPGFLNAYVSDPPCVP